MARSRQDNQDASNRVVNPGNYEISCHAMTMQKTKPYDPGCMFLA